jgi:hypothetical protein
MVVLHLLAEDSREYEIVPRPERFRLATMYSNDRCGWFPAPKARTTDVP